MENFSTSQIIKTCIIKGNKKQICSRHVIDKKKFLINEKQQCSSGYLSPDDK